MSERSRAALGALKAIVALLEREARAINLRDFRTIAMLTKEKSTLSGKIESLFDKLASAEKSDALDRQLEAVAALAQQNAQHLLMLQTGLSDAQRRLKSLIEDERRTGAYAQSGAAIKRAAPARLERDA